MSVLPFADSLRLCSMLHRHEESWSVKHGTGGDDWLKRLKRQDRQAQRDFLELHYPFVYHRACAEARNHDPRDAEDITQEVFFRALRSIGSFDGKSGPRGWLMRLCQHAAADLYRSRGTRHEAPADSQPVPGSTEPATTDPAKTPAPLKRCIDRQRSERLRDALDLLNPEQRAVVEHRFFEGLSVQETAELMGKTVASVKMAQCRALRKLALLGLQGGDAP